MNLIYHPNILRAEVCRCCREPLYVSRNASLRGTEVSHRCWSTIFDDRMMTRADDLTVGIRAWMASEHHEAALALCGEIIRMYRRRTQA